MQYVTKFVGLDVSKEKISVAIADAGRDLRPGDHVKQIGGTQSSLLAFFVQVN
ncbi:hypothetical protein [Paenibacillus silvisoli]|uniref:hypothetical protein n=1 Tax=Paenibacillus silvisoli TaxID=3110539 RepID=UPI002803CF25|nr:hypothetical protein [Paenibacillus silvisoli]